MDDCKQKIIELINGAQDVAADLHSHPLFLQYERGREA